MKESITCGTHFSNWRGQKTKYSKYLNGFFFVPCACLILFNAVTWFMRSRVLIKRTICPDEIKGVGGRWTEDNKRLGKTRLLLRNWLFYGQLRELRDPDWSLAPIMTQGYSGRQNLHSSEGLDIDFNKNRQFYSQNTTTFSVLKIYHNTLHYISIDFLNRPVI